MKHNIYYGPHREMAVDCPDNFIARNKTPPRYPPPRPPQQQQQQNNNNNKSSITSTSTTASLKSLKKFKNPAVLNSAVVGKAGSLDANELELMVDGLYRKDSSSRSSAYDDVLSKKSGESFDSITFRNNNTNSNNNNKHSNNNHNQLASPTTSGHTKLAEPSAGHNDSNSNSNNINKQPNGSVGDSLRLHSAGGSLNSTRSSDSDDIGMPPPEYELRDLSLTNASLILPPLVKHRELPVDVPDSFIEIIKTTPRYPPPPHLSSLSSQLSHSLSSNSTANTTLTHINSSSNSGSSAAQLSSSFGKSAAACLLPELQLKDSLSSSSHGSIEHDLVLLSQTTTRQQPQPQVAHFGLVDLGIGETSKRNDELR